MRRVARIPWTLLFAAACGTAPDVSPSPIDANGVSDDIANTSANADTVDGAHSRSGRASPCNSGCDDGNLCTTDVCEPWGICEHFSLQCFDGNVCTHDDCQPNAGCTHKLYSCDDGDLCTSDTCLPSAGCQYTKTGCSDNNACTLDVCAHNACQSTAVADGGVCASAGGVCMGGECVTDGCGASLGAFPIKEKPGFRAWRAVAMANGQFVVAGFFDEAPVVQTKLLLVNGDGSLQAQIPVTGPKAEIQEAVLASDGAVLLCGEQHPPNGDSVVWFGRSDKFGPVVPTLFANPQWYSCTALVPMEDGGAVLGGAGAWGGTGSGPSWVARVSASGIVVWEKQVAIQDYNAALRLGPWSNGDIAAVVSSHNASDPSTITLVRLSTTGEQLWQKIAEPTQVYAIYRLLPTLSGQLRGLGQIWLGGKLTAGLVRFDNDGKLLWTKPLPGNAADSGFATANGGAVVVLSTDGAPTLVRLDAADNVVSVFAPKFAEKVALTAALSAPKGQIALLGLGGYDANAPIGVLPFTSSWLALADPWGHLTCATAGNCAGLTGCDDGDGCTLDNCLPASGCNHVILSKGATCAAN